MAVCRSFPPVSPYITNNGGSIPNYRDRYYYGEAISTGFVGFTVNQVVSKRMVKKQQMRMSMMTGL